MDLNQEDGFVCMYTYNQNTTPLTYLIGLVELDLVMTLQNPIFFHVHIVFFLSYDKVDDQMGKCTLKNGKPT